jgi:hypothetical protein
MLYQRRKLQHNILGELKKIYFESFEGKSKPIHGLTIDELSQKLKKSTKNISPAIFELVEDKYVWMSGIEKPYSFGIENREEKDPGNNGITAYNSEKFIRLFNLERKEFWLKTFQLIGYVITIISLCVALYSARHKCD